MGSLRELVKALARGAAFLGSWPMLLLYRISGSIVDRDKAFHGASQALSLIPGLPGEYIRREFYRRTLEECAPDCCISFGTILSKRGARIGRRVYIGTGCTLGLVTLEDDVLLASNVDVISGSRQHFFDDSARPIREQGGMFARVTVGADSWIGNRAVVMADVGRGSVVGAGSVVVREVPERSLAAGAPAKVLRRRDPPAAPVAKELSAAGSRERG
jgi:acetyltransferase-like isoleucine patch superfamily enzyme